MIEQRPLPNGWRVSEEYAESKQSSYVKKIVEELSAIPRLISEPPKEWNGKAIKDLSAEDREEFYFSQQPESTKQAILRQKERKPHEDIDYLLRPMPECVANPDAKDLNELTAKRQLGLEETLLVEDIRRKGRNTLGQSENSSVDQAKRQAGIEAFTYSKPYEPKDEELKRVAKLTGLEAVIPAFPPKEPETPKKKRFWSWLFGEDETTGTGMSKTNLKIKGNSIIYTRDDDTN